MGTTHLNAYSKIPGVQIAAVCSDNPLTRSGDFTKVGGHLPEHAILRDFSAVRRYQDWRVLARDPEIDILDICLPTDLHAPIALAALEAGKHVLCEKPMALSGEDCDRMIAASLKYDRILMIGQVLRFWPEYEYLRDFATSGAYGRVRSATFIRSCGVPDWSRWLPDPSRSGGAVLDLLSHDVDRALEMFGLPQRVAAKSIAGPDAMMATLIYPGGPEVRIQGGWFAPGTPLSMSFLVRADRAELEWTPTGLMLSDHTGQRKQVDVSSTDAYDAELSYFVDCCRTGSQPARCPPQASALAVKVALLIRESKAAGGRQLQCAF